MIITKASARWLSLPPKSDILERIEYAGRTAYKSEDKITEDSATKFVANLIARQHESVIEHVSLSAKIICDRGVSHEIVRHRLASYTQESTRYCNYSNSNELTFIAPCFFNAIDPTTNSLLPRNELSSAYLVWEDAMLWAQRYYLQLMSMGCKPQEARNVLPNSLKTEIVMTANLREWRHFFKMRCDKAAHPQMREIGFMLYDEIHRHLPEVFPEEYVY